MIDQSELKAKFLYDPEEGVLYNRRLGNVAGSVIKNGYRIVETHGQAIMSTHIIWAYMTGEWPKSTVDHIDRDTSNNRWSNLRLATMQQQSYNRGITITNKSGVVGVSWYKRSGQWMASIGVERRQLHLGYFDSFDAAVAARKAAEERYHKPSLAA